MGLSHKSRGKRSDKETQSPMLKIFKDMMIKDKRDPEKTNLLKEKHQDRKRKIYYSSRSKSGHRTVLSSSSDQPKESQQPEYVRTEHQVRTTTCLSEQSIGSQNAPNKSTKSKHASDTCSYVSCAFRKLFNSEYTCVATIALLFMVSVIVGVAVLYRSVPCISSGEAFVANSASGLVSSKMDSERLKRRIGGLGKWSFGPKKEWQNIFTKHGNAGFDSFNVQHNDIASLVESESELSKILDTDKLSDIQDNDRLKDFYKKLVQADAAIRNLRKSLDGNSYVNNLDSSYNFNNLGINMDLDNNSDVDNDDPNRSIDITYLDRSKRSINMSPNRLFSFKRRDPVTQSKISNGKFITKSTINMTGNKHPIKTENCRRKRRDNFTDGSFLIEKNKVIIQYKPNRKVAKCSHAPKDLKSHEIQLNHPFYKNSQRLDELLNQFMYNKKMSDFPSDQFHIFDQNKKCKHPSNDAIILVKDDYISKDYDLAQKDQRKDDDHYKQNHYITSDLKVETEKVMLEKDKIDQEATVSDYTTPKVTMKVKSAKDTRNAFDNDVFEESVGMDKERRSSTSGFDILLSISTTSIPAVEVSTSNPSTNIQEMPNMRKLLEAKIKEQDAMTYDDLTVVAPNYKEESKEKDKDNDRKESNEEEEIKLDSAKNYINSVQNPNWKGAMPLYPEELNVIMKPSSHLGNKVEVPVHSRDTAPESDAAFPRLTDVEYVEDYLDNGYEKLVELAQAYSDYGVLNKKNEVDKEKKEVEKDRQISKKKRLGMSMERLKNSLKRGMKSNVVFDKLEKDGIRIEIHPEPLRSEAPASTNHKGIFQKHVNIVNDNQDKKCMNKMILHALVTPKPEPEVVTPLGHDFNEPFITKIKTTKTLDAESDTIYKKRTLKALEKGHVARDEKKTKFNVQLKRDTNSEVMYKEIQGASLKNRPVDSNQNKMGTSNSSEKDMKAKEKNVEVKADGKTGVNPNPGENNSVTKESASLSNFFVQLSNWFNTMDEIDLTSRNAAKMTPSDTNQSSKTKSQLTDSIHDPDKAEGIIHKSRALLSVDIYNNTEKVSRSDKEDKLVTLQSTTVSDPIDTKKTLLLVNIKDTANNEGAASNDTDNKIVKRQAIDDSNLIFWNDLYDEEYGINAEPSENNNIRDKHSIDRNDFIKKSNSWIHDKVKKIANRFYPTETRKDAKAKSEDKSKQVKRSAYDENDEENSGKVNFSALTERMKEVCRETVKAVKDTRHIEVREENKPGHATSTLMQQLVRLMTDLVDFQVQERTCRKLPADLQTFLDWLTGSKEDDSDLGTYTEKNLETYGMSFENTRGDLPVDKPAEDLLQSSERENTDSKTDCLGTLHAVQNLIREYEEMSEDDKSRMIGVKDYLENQMQFLQRQLTSIEDTQDNMNRFRRDIIADVGHTIADTVDDTARNIDKQYKNLKKYYHKYKGKAGQAYKHAMKSTEQIKSTIEDMGKKMTTARAKTKPCKIPNKLLKVNDTPNPKIAKEKVTKAHKDRKSIKSNKEKQKEISFKNKHKLQVKGKNKLDIKDDNDFNYDLKIKDYPADFDTRAFGNGIKNERNIKDVYFKAVEEAKKATISKGAQRDSEVFDKTDVFRIDDYVAEEDNDSQIDVYSN